MKLSVGIIGLPNVGKSTLFNALLKKQQALAANYPFATVEPNVGIVAVEDERLERLARIVKTERVVPAVVEFVDIAGLVKGASQGEGLGNKFLGHIREVDLVCLVLRGFKDEEIVETGSGDMVEDYLTIETEVQLADLTSLEKQKQPKGKVEKDELFRWEVIKKIKENLEKGISVREVGLGEQEIKGIKDLFLLTLKKMILVLNVQEKDLVKEKEIKKQVLERFKEKNIEIDEKEILVISAKTEAELGGFNEKERADYLSQLGTKEGGLEKLAKIAYGRLGLISFLTAGEKEVRAWTIKRGMRANEAAGVIHTDFMKNFIKAKVCEFKDFLEYSGWKGAGEAGKVRLEGKDYLVKEGEIIEFMVGK